MLKYLIYRRTATAITHKITNKAITMGTTTWILELSAMKKAKLNRSLNGIYKKTKYRLGIKVHNLRLLTKHI